MARPAAVHYLYLFSGDGAAVASVWECVAGASGFDGNGVLPQRSARSGRLSVVARRMTADYEAVMGITEGITVFP